MTARVFIFIIGASALLYLLVLLVFTIGWYRMKVFTSSLRNLSTRVSVVVAFRNEEQYIENLLQSLMEQTYPHELWEIILINDHSTDKSPEIIKEFIKGKIKVKITLLNANGHGKKQSIVEGVQYASGNLIVCTDGDCTAGKNWLTNVASFYEQEHPLLIFGAVVYDQEVGFWQKFFSFEFMSLVASGAGSGASGLPFMGNGANLAFERDAFLEAGAEAQKQEHASGDDVFLIQYLTQKYGSQTIRFLKNKASIIRTQAPKTFKAFMKQRIRWGSKAKAYDQPWPIFVAFTVFVFNTLLALCFLLGFVIPWALSIFLLFVLLKFFIDLPLLQAFGEFSNKGKLLKYMLLFEIIYPFYIPVAALKGLFFSYEWKGRQVK
ncbi:MAG: glycosyltransferase [Bacteroidales bacterium]|nr:glycosyltransferase [Bacteroidales bacterium]